MTLELYVLVDEFGRIYYTGKYRQQVEDYQRKMNFNNFKIIVLKGEIE